MLDLRLDSQHGLESASVMPLELTRVASRCALIHRWICHLSRPTSSAACCTVAHIFISLMPRLSS